MKEVNLNHRLQTSTIAGELRKTGGITQEQFVELFRSKPVTVESLQVAAEAIVKVRRAANEMVRQLFSGEESGEADLDYADQRVWADMLWGCLRNQVFAGDSKDIDQVQFHIVDAEIHRLFNEMVEVDE